MIDRPDNPSDHVAVLTRTVGPQDGDRHDLDTGETDAGNSQAVVRSGRDDAGHRRAVAVRVGQAVRSIEDRVPRDDIPGEIGMCGGNARIEDRHDGRTRRDDSPVDLVPADPWQRPLERVISVGGRALGAPNSVSVDSGDSRIRSQGGHGFRGRRGRKQDRAHPELWDDVSRDRSD